MTEMKGGRICWLIFLVKVWPSVSSFCRCPSILWPNISWKNTRYVAREWVEFKLRECASRWVLDVADLTATVNEGGIDV